MASTPSSASTSSDSPEVRASGEITETLVEAQGNKATTSPALARDFSRFAKQTGQDVAEIEEQFHGIKEFGKLATELEEKYADSYVGAAVAPEGSRAKYVLSFTKMSIEKARELLADTGEDVLVRTGLPATAAELAASAESLVASMAGDGGKFSFVASFRSEDSLGQTIKYSVPEEISERPTPFEIEQSQKRAREASAKSSSDGRLPVAVRFEALPPGVRAGEETTVQGGRTLTLADGALHCTAGFTAEHTDGRRGVLTARHCDNALRYSGIADIISTSPIGASDTSGGQHIDLQWHPTLTANGHTTNYDFRATGTVSGTDNTVHAVTNAVVGQVACHWGATTGTGDSCGIVIDINNCRSGDWLGGTTCGLDYMDRDVSAPGDSGGPWFLGDTAMGIHTGEPTAAGVNMSYFTRISRVAGHMNLTVMVAP